MDMQDNRLGEKKILTVVALLCIISGLFMAAAGFFMGAKYGVFINGDGISVIGKNTNNSHKTSDLEIITSIKIDASDADIEFIQSDSFYVETYSDFDDFTFNCEVIDGVLYISDGGKSKFYLFLGLKSPKNYIKIYVPNDSEFDSIYINNNSGAITISDLYTGYLEIYCSSGDFTAKNITGESAYMNFGSGNSRIEDMSFVGLEYKNDDGQAVFLRGTFDYLSANLSNGDIKFDGSAADILEISNLYGKITANNVKTRNISIKNTEGNTALAGDLAGSIYIDASYGDVSVKTTLKETDFNYNLETRSGTIYLDGQKSLSMIVSRDVPNEMMISNVGGDIRVTFEYK